jgi:hypothetical protein
MQKALETVVADGYKNEICRLSTCLKAKAGASKLDEGWCAPAMAGAATDNALTILGTDDEGTFLEAGNDCDAGSLGGDAIWNAFIGGGHKFVKNCVGGVDALVELCFIGGSCRQGCE